MKEFCLGDNNKMRGQRMWHILRLAATDSYISRSLSATCFDFSRDAVLL